MAAVNIIGQVSRKRENNDLTHPRCRFLFTSGTRGNKIHVTVCTSQWPRCVWPCASRMDGAEADGPDDSVASSAELA